MTKQDIVLVYFYDTSLTQLMTKQEAFEMFKAEEDQQLTDFERAELSTRVEYFEINSKLDDKHKNMNLMLTVLDLQPTVYHVDCQADIYLFA